MSKLHTLVVQGLLLLLVAFGVEAEMPDRIESGQATESYFISSEVVLQMKSEDPSYERAKNSLKRYQNLPETDGCTKNRLVDTRYEPAWGRPRLEEMVQRVDAIVPVTVIDRKIGFQDDNLGQLLKFEFEAPFKGKVMSKEAYFFVPAGKVELMGRQYCLSAYGVPEPPTVGERAVVFLYHQRFDPESAVLHIPMTHLIRLPRSGSIEVSPFLDLLGQYSSGRLPTSEEFLEDIRDQLDFSLQESRQ